MSLRPASLTLLVVALALAGAAGARSTDRNQPMDTESDHQSGTFTGNSVNVLSGNVHITQGSLDVRAGRAEITMRDGEAVRAVLTGAPVTLTQAMDDGTPITARASTVDYDLKGQTAVFTGNVQIQQPRGTMTGARVVYNLNTGNIESGGEGNGRVRMHILPKTAAPAPAADKGKP
ncbi:MAG TPA: lipopolysaccharide transport periplasmic protein LptA [Xanthomonadaceae bacterium]|nr:lipopolysaccharide transport periplasmic protein LptA [Xanthomonadaceae bacterium]